MNDNIHSDYKKRIMIVDDNTTNLMVAKKALEDVYKVVPVPSGKKALEILVKITSDLILLDVDMPEMDGFETLRRIKSNHKTDSIPIIFLTAKDDSKSELEGLKLGAVDYITKPFSIPLLLKRISIHLDLVGKKKELEFYNENLTRLVNEKTEIIYELQNAIITSLINLVECRDGLTGGHVVRTQKYLELLIKGAYKCDTYVSELESIDIGYLLQSCQLHDIGKIATPDIILRKPGSLTKEEFNIIKEHTVVGEQAILRAMNMTRSKDFLNYAAVLAISHHERWDGSGYPYGLAEDKIPLPGRIMAISDVYDALVSERPYKKAFSHKEAYDIIVSESGKHFDPDIVKAFTMVSDDFFDVSQSVTG